MKSDISLSLANIATTVHYFLYRFGLITIFIVIAIGLAISVFLLNSVITQTDKTDGYVPVTTSVTFDEKTVQKIETLKAEGEPTNKVEVSGRLLPF